MAAVKKKAVLAASTANATGASAIERQSGVVSADLISHLSPQLPVIKRTADELPNSDGPSEPAGRCPAPGHVFGDGPASLGSTSELAAESSRQLGRTDGALVAGRAGPQRPYGQHKPQAKGSEHTEPAASSEAVPRRMTLGDMFGPLCGMPDGTSNALVATVSRPQSNGKIRPQ